MTRMPVRFAAVRWMLASLLALTLIASGVAATEMAVEHGAGMVEHSDHAKPQEHAPHAADRDACQPQDADDGALCCGHPACAAGWSLAAASAQLALSVRPRPPVWRAFGFALASRQFPSLEPPRS
jgi:hypothetical protein